MRRCVPFLLSFGLLGCPPAEAPPQAPEDEPRPAASGSTAAPEPESVPEDRERVVFLGTSLTAGLGLTHDEDTYVSRVAELADSAGLPIEAVNAGVSGETSAGGLRRLDWVLREPLDVLVVELGANDGLRGLDPAALESNLRSIVARTRARYPDAGLVLAGMEAPPNLGGIYVDRFRSVFRRVAEDTGVALVPFLLDGVAGVPELNQSDGIHPTADGHRIMAARLWPVLEALLRARADADGSP